MAGTVPRIGELVPDFEAETTRGTLKFSEWQGGKWVILFSPPDFTPVCMTELAEFARRFLDFVQRDTKLMGLSCNRRKFALRSEHR